MNKLLFIIYIIPSSDLSKPLMQNFGFTSSNSLKGIAFEKTYDDLVDLPEERNVDIVLVPDGENLEKMLEPIIREAEEVVLVVHKSSSKKDLQKRRISSLAGARLKSPSIDSHHSSGPIFNLLLKIAATRAIGPTSYNGLLSELECLIKFDILKERKAQLFYFCYAPKQCQRLIKNKVRMVSSHTDFSILLQEPQINNFIRRMANHPDLAISQNLSDFNELRANFAKVLFMD